jgi:hypothetical protein
MPIVATPEPAHLATTSASAYSTARQELRSSKPIDLTAPQLFTLTQRHFVVGGQHLVLDDYPQIAVYPGRFEFEIVGWNLRLPYGKQTEIGRELIRKFLLLHAKAEKLSLSEHEEAEWADIAKRVDYRRFSIDRSPPQFVQGLLMESNETSAKVRWHDGTTERICGNSAAALRLLDIGERFTAHARFGENNVLSEIRNVAPAGPLNDDDGERMWRAWPVSPSS